ncbi:flagellar biosynthesis chaperone FliJ [Erwinia sp. OLTSP20]|uniref:flagellar export protein FliJ n=1 Tax=unclassified Erwinia TaxID=2622719 RepID=UPI000C183504|nr:MULTISPECIES: flagellar export protein FliJ [unclassified Erwinia]PIJ48455.1 flagellar biosynthesis chaperone FliJ [Erwinia sp. OAMSP11]PIJ67628.1 flagellar biosynthesis chaperone FliJ [Erwinia sp. OLSSP12]PIJ78576.1 flagellar biosynthesis chaperone FliJ [Erwinia sp. OLCASP19]PIJ79460.1 flagellar biosynthesis chaperone FliJ [Erwinia sp. OLMTSP26]PIJ81001.1 flagellar biosynthesis chaperone FliJ [Erwinia sp. OLMDSP33]
MKNSNTMNTLCDLAQQELDKAVVQLGDVRRGHQQAEEQLTMLLNYQDEYRLQLNDSMVEGMASDRWYNYHLFIQTLEKAIEQHRLQLSQWSLRLENALTWWRDKQQRVQAFQTLQARAAASERRQENRRDQKRMDEFAQRASLRKGQ